jgi:HD superfamily phosphodiesterase
MPKRKGNKMDKHNEYIHSVTYEDIKNNKEILTYINAADNLLGIVGYTKHDLGHVGKVADISAYILTELGYNERYVELAKIAGIMHDIGNMVNRDEHAQTGAVLAFHILRDMGMDPEEIVLITSAIGNHDEGTGQPVNLISAALILADKSDVRRSRVRNMVQRSYR